MKKTSLVLGTTRVVPKVEAVKAQDDLLSIRLSDGLMMVEKVTNNDKKTKTGKWSQVTVDVPGGIPALLEKDQVVRSAAGEWLKSSKLTVGDTLYLQAIYTGGFPPTCKVTAMAEVDDGDDDEYLPTSTPNENCFVAVGTDYYLLVAGKKTAVAEVVTERLPVDG